MDVNVFDYSKQIITTSGCFRLCETNYNNVNMCSIVIIIIIIIIIIVVVVAVVVVVIVIIISSIIVVVTTNIVGFLTNDKTNRILCDSANTTSSSVFSSIIETETKPELHDAAT